MSKKHFRKLAYKLALLEPKESEYAHSTWYECVQVMAGVCSEANPAFNYSTFISACHLQWWQGRVVPS